MVLIPVQPRSFDIWEIDAMQALVSEAREINDRLRAVVVLNGADAQGSDNEAAAEVLREAQGLDFLPVSIGRRKAFPNAAASGRSVTEHASKDAKAAHELAALADAAFA
ncbi:MAG: chromosome partitioning protein ParA, partial [Rhodopila sp.]